MGPTIGKKPWKSNTQPVGWVVQVESGGIEPPSGKASRHRDPSSVPLGSRRRFERDETRHRVTQARVGQETASPSCPKPEEYDTRDAAYGRDGGGWVSAIRR